MFMGEYSHTLDTKGRLIIPAKFRSQLGDKFIVTRWMEHALPLGKKEARQFKRFVMAGAIEAETDKQGRIVIPVNLKEYAGLNKAVTVTGAGDAFEIWSDDNWDEYTSETANNFDDIAEGLVDFEF